VQFTKLGAPDITIKGKYVQRMPFIFLPPASVHSVHSTVPMSYTFPPIQPEILSEHNDTAVHQVLHVLHSSNTSIHPSQLDSRNAVCLFFDTITYDWTHGSLPITPVLHVVDVVNRTLWHIHTCHPNTERLVILSKFSKRMPKPKRPQSIEKCYDCLIAKM
jgi:hypothetical protein